MPAASGRKPLLYRDQCLGLDVVALARGGFLAPGLHTGDVELLDFGNEFGAQSMRIRSFFGPREGDLSVYRPVEESIPARPVDTPLGPRWRLICKPCGGLVKRLYVPEVPEGPVPAVWACRSCWRIGYRRGGRRGRRQSAREDLAEIRRIREGLDALEEVVRWRLREWEEGRAADAT